MSVLTQRFAISITSHIKHGHSRSSFYLNGLIDRLTIDEVKSIESITEGDLSQYMNEDKTELNVTDTEDFRGRVVSEFGDMISKNELTNFFNGFSDERIIEISDGVKADYQSTYGA